MLLLKDVLLFFSLNTCVSIIHSDRIIFEDDKTEEVKYVYENSECKINGTKPGTCQYFGNCFAAFSLKDSPPHICGSDGDERLVCCVSNTDEAKESTNETLGVSERMCKQYESQLCGKLLYPKVELPLIIVGGGIKSEPREFPHMTAIGYGSRSKIEWQCGGSLISDRYVLSAAHCTDAGSSIGKARWVYLGDVKLRRNGPPHFEIIQHINHPDYKPPVLYNDIALYKLDRVVRFTAFIKPICLHTSHQIPSSKGIATGWGRQGYAHPVSDDLMKVDLTFVSPHNCSGSAKRSLVQLPSGIDSESMVCAGEKEGVKDTCQGDSGGPLSIVGKKCIRTLVGITSVGSLCGLPDSPGIYTRVSHFVPWIESIVWPTL